MSTLCLPKLNNLKPNLESTLLKAVEEAGELARAVLNFLPYANEAVPNESAKILLQEVAEELLDVAQTCVTMIFVLEESYQVNVDSLIGTHLAKLDTRGYYYDAAKQYVVTTTGAFKFLYLPKLAIPNVDLLRTVCKIQEELGELTQFIGKCSGASGEKNILTKQEIMQGSTLELLDVAQCCFTMIYILEDQYFVDIKELTARHIVKLCRKGYYA